MSDFNAIIEKYAKKHGVDAGLVRRVVQQESGGNPRAVSPVGARGLMQLMPGTARGLGVRDSFDPEQNIGGGVRYLAQQLKAFGGDARLALAAYNAGPGNVRKYGGVPPFRETQNYVNRILGGSTVATMPKRKSVKNLTKSPVVEPVAARSASVRGAALPPERRQRYNPLQTGDFEAYLGAIDDLNAMPRTSDTQVGAARDSARSRYMADKLPELTMRQVTLPDYTPAPRPVRQNVDLPTRQPVGDAFGTEAAVVTALLGLLGGAAGPAIGAAGLQGAQGAVNTRYEDAMLQAQNEQRRADMAFGDNMDAYTDRERLNLSDRALRYQSDQQNAQQEYNRARELMGLQADIAGQGAYGQALGRQSQQEAAIRAQAGTADALRQEIEQRRLISDQSIADDAAYSKALQDAAEFNARMDDYEQNRLSREGIAQDNRGLRAAIAGMQNETRQRGQNMALVARQESNRIARERIRQAKEKLNSEELKDPDVKLAIERWEIQERALASAKANPRIGPEEEEYMSVLETNVRDAWKMLEDARANFRAKRAGGSMPSGITGVPGFGGDVGGRMRNALSDALKMPSTPSEVAPAGKVRRKPQPSSVVGSVSDALFERARGDK